MDWEELASELPSMSKYLEAAVDEEEERASSGGVPASHQMIPSERFRATVF